MEPAARHRRWWKYLLIAAGVVVLFASAAIWYTTTNSFQRYVRRRVVREIERITGGRAEVGSFHVVPFHLQVEIRNVTVHGKEAPWETPLAHADSLLAQVKVISFLRTEFGFHDVVLDHPVVHIAIGPDGTTTNVPGLRVPTPVPVDARIQQLFALSIDHLSVLKGELLWGDQKIPLDFSVRGTDLQMDYSYLRGRYESRLKIGKVDTVYNGYRPFSWSTSGEFSLGPTFVDIQMLDWTSGHSVLKANGRVSNFSNPRFDGSYDAQIDLEDAAAIVRRNDLRRGSAEFKGSGHWTLQEFASSGTIAMRDLGWQDDQVAIKGANFTSDYSLTDRELKLSKLQGKLLGGSVSGDADVENWLYSTPLPPAAKSRREDIAVISATRSAKPGEKRFPGVQSGVVHLRLRDLSLAETAAALDVRKRPVERFHPAGLTVGNVDASWKGSPKNADIAFSISAVPSARTTARELPITADMQGKYHALTDSLELAKFNLLTPASKVQASGTLATPSTLHISISTSNLEEWRPLVTLLGGPTDLPFRVDGNASFSGVVGGTFSSPTLAGTLVAEDFEFTVPATSRTPEKPVHWDSLAANIQFSNRSLILRGGSLRRGDTSADFEVAASLQKGQFTESSPYTARVNLHNVDVASTAALADFDYPVTGTADVSLQISGTRAHPQVQGHIHATNASAYDEPIERFDADLRIKRSETTLENIQLTHENATVTGMAAYTPSTRGFRLDLVGKNFDVSRIRQVHLDRLPMQGRADFTLKGDGTLDAPDIDTSVQVRDLMLDRELVGELDLKATTKNGQLHLSGQSQFVHGTLNVDGNVSMHGDYPANITARADHLDVDALWRAYLGHQLTAHSAVGGQVTMQGPLRYPEQWTLNGTLPAIAVEVEHTKLHNQDPVTFTYAQQT
ncbi:MAG TPA: hypothetical protein VJQ59_07835, partial [Candidatus Sulfotelmatobacter sp.]|nr:hypothetical protein [Candidatus Sulfotelmatobacter sp.]